MEDEKRYTIDELLAKIGVGHEGEPELSPLPNETVRSDDQIRQAIQDITGIDASQIVGVILRDVRPELLIDVHVDDTGTPTRVVTTPETITEEFMRANPIIAVRVKWGILPAPLDPETVHTILQIVTAQIFALTHVVENTGCYDEGRMQCHHSTSRDRVQSYLGLMRLLSRFPTR